MTTVYKQLPEEEGGGGRGFGYHFGTLDINVAAMFSVSHRKHCGNIYVTLPFSGPQCFGRSVLH